MRRVLRVLLILLTVVLLALVAAVFALDHWLRGEGRAWLDTTVRERLGGTVEKAIVGGYHFTMEELHADARSGNVRITGIRIAFDSTLQDSLRAGVHDYLFAADADTISIEALSIWRILLLQRVVVGKVTVSAPRLRYYVGGKRMALDAPFRRLGQAGGTGQTMDEVLLEEISIRDAAAEMHDLSGHLPILVARGLDLDMRRMRITRSRIQPRSRLTVQALDVGLDSLYTELPDGYVLAFGAIRLSDTERKGSIRDLRILPPTGAQANASRTTIAVDSILLYRPEISDLITDQALRMRKAEVHGMHLLTEQDKSQPGMERSPKPLPPAQLLGISFPIAVDTLAVLHSDIHYRERSDITGQWADITFNAVQARFTGITNSPLNPRSGEGIRGDISCAFLDTATLIATYHAELNSSERFTFTATVEHLPMTALAPITRPLLRLDLSAGTLHRMHMVMRGNAVRARGDMTMQYSELLAAVSPEATRAQHHGMFGALLEHALEADQGGALSDSLRRSYTVQRDPDRSLITFIWHFTRAGIQRDMRRGVMDRINLLLRKRTQDDRERKASPAPR